MLWTKLVFIIKSYVADLHRSSFSSALTSPQLK